MTHFNGFTPEEVAAVIQEVEQNADPDSGLAAICDIVRILTEYIGEALPELTPWERDAIIERLKERRNQT